MCSFEENNRKSREATIFFDEEYVKAYARLAFGAACEARRNALIALASSVLAFFFSSLALLKSFGVF